MFESELISWFNGFYYLLGIKNYIATPQSKKQVII